MFPRALSIILFAAWCGGLWFLLEGYSKLSPDKPVPPGPLTVGWIPFFAQGILPALPVAEHFDFPVRPPSGKGAVQSHGFWFENHIGEDWSTAPGNGDLGEPVFACADGWVALALDFQGAWGKVVMIDHRLGVGRWPPFVEIMFAHLQTMEVQQGAFVKRGQRIGTMGNADGVYKAHLHWEVRQTVGMGLGGGYAEKQDGWLPPTEFIQAHRGDRNAVSEVITVSPRESAKWGSD